MIPDKLANPAWHSLNEMHNSFAIGEDEIKFYPPSICRFGGINSKKTDLVSFLQNHPELSSFFIIGDKPQTSLHLTVEKELVCLQMICAAPIKIEITQHITRLNNTYEKELYDLVNLVQPGYFEERTSLMGDYFGIFKNGKLVAVTGERMKMFDFTEISAVVTHPGFIGQGFAKQLVAYTANRILKTSIIPYLHVAETNTTAISLYEKLGFVTRRRISFWKMKRTFEK
jgi:GNAT superfamily N-acetyltransferase